MVYAYEKQGMLGSKGTANNIRRQSRLVLALPKEALDPVHKSF